jgi:hypothetical protein
LLSLSGEDQLTPCWCPYIVRELKSIAALEPTASGVKPAAHAAWPARSPYELQKKMKIENVSLEEPEAGKIAQN